MSTPTTTPEQHAPEHVTDEELARILRGSLDGAVETLAGEMMGVRDPEGDGDGWPEYQEVARPVVVQMRAMAAELRALRAPVADVEGEVEQRAREAWGVATCRIPDEAGWYALKEVERFGWRAAVRPYVERAAVLARENAGLRKVLGAEGIAAFERTKERDAALAERDVLVREVEGLRAEVARLRQPDVVQGQSAITLEAYRGELDVARADAAIARGVADHWATRFNQAQERASADHDEIEVARAEAADWASRFEQAKGQADTARAEIERLASALQQDAGNWADLCDALGVGIDDEDGPIKRARAMRAEIERLKLVIEGHEAERRAMLENESEIRADAKRLGATSDAWKGLAKAREGAVYHVNGPNAFRDAQRAEGNARATLRALGIDPEAP